MKAGTLEIQGEEVSNMRDIACLYMRARGLPKAGGMGPGSAGGTHVWRLRLGADVQTPTDAALAISALNDRATGWQQVGRTEFVFGTVMGTTEPIW